MSKTRPTKSDKRPEGRPPIPRAKRRTAWIGTHVTDAELAAQKSLCASDAEVARRNGGDVLTWSAWVRVRLGLPKTPV